MLVIEERNSSKTPTVTYTRALDLSGMLDGAGAIGGLLARSHGYSSGSWTNHNFYHADGNGNITAMVGANQTLVASYRYDPYGQTTYSSGSLASANVYRFSSKPSHANSGLYYYGYRFYYPELQRWVSRDPIQEAGGLALYAFVANNPVTFMDYLGLIFKYKGPYAAQYEHVIECWKNQLAPDSRLRKIVSDLETSPRDIRINSLASAGPDISGNPITRPATRADLLDIGKGHDTTSWLDPHCYTYDNRTWTFEQALAQELLHAHDYQDPCTAHRGHGGGFMQEEKIITDEAGKLKY